MANNSVTKIFSFFRSFLIYEPPSDPPRFVLKEKESTKPGKMNSLSQSTDELNTLLRFAHRLESTMEQVKNTIRHEPSPNRIDTIQQETEVLEAQKAELSPILLAYTSSEDLEQRSISASLAENILIIKKLFQLPHNQDIVIREFGIPANPSRKAMLVFADGLVDKKVINLSVLEPLMSFGSKKKSLDEGDILRLLITDYLPDSIARQSENFQTVIKGINGGDTALFVDGARGAALIETRGFEHRAIERPAVEQTVRGSQSSFTETLRTNISLVRLTLRSRDLVTELITLGARSQIDCAVMYLESVANPDLVSEVKRRLSNISTDYIADGILEQFIEDHPNIPIPQTLSTERPDRVAPHLSEGRVAILLDGSPFALVVPITLFTLFHSPEDFALKLPAGSFMRILRLTAAFLAAIFPSLYMAISYYHPEALPTDIVLAIAGARERVPFPAILEVIDMELSFEFIREAGTRIPGLLGNTIGIIGAVILGQAVVAAGIVNPITVVIIAITGMASFAVPDFRTGMAIRLVRFAFLVAAVSLGLVGVASGLFVMTVILCSMKSFGVPYLSPIGPKTMPGLDVVIRGPVYRQEERPDELNTLDQRRQPPISRKWTKKQPAGGDTTDEL
ncbi:MAG: spore germination protein [Negativicutes bacterium]|nr:spore germination protein [Negativicutes bacterium]